MAMPMPKMIKILTELRQLIRENHFGRPGEKFIGIRELAASFSLQTCTAQEIFKTLRDEGLLMLSGKKHYLSHGIIPSHSPLGKLRQERKIIALLTDHLESYYIPTFADSVAACLRKEGYFLETFHVSEEERLKELRLLYDMGVQGFLVLMDLASSNAICQMSNLPCATSGYDCTAVGADSVLSGGSEQAKAVADMMIEGGCTRFFFATPRRDVLEEKSIYTAFLARLRERGILYDSDIITDKELKNNLNFLHRRLRVENEKIGVVCTNEQVTQRIMRFCDEHRVSVPEKVMVAAFRTKSPMNQQRREIITVEENIEKEAQEATAVLLNRIRGDTSPTKLIVVDPKVINRIMD